MRVPPFFLAASALFWGWHVQLPVLGMAMALAIEGRRVVDARWRFTPSDFARIADLCTWAFVIVAGYLSFTRGMPIPVLEIFMWLPLAILPLLLAQLYSESGRLPLSALFLMLRGGTGDTQRIGDVDLSYPFAAVCVLAAGTANLRQDSYYGGLVLLCAWALWHARSPRYRWYVWAPLLACASLAGYAGHVGLNRLQGIVLESAIEWLSGSSARTDPYRSMTDIGYIGELKQSDRIVLRVRAHGDLALPLLLHRASYDVYVSPSWIARDAPFSAVAAEPDQSSWDFGPVPAAPVRITIAEHLQRGKAVLSLPAGTARIERLAMQEMQRNRLGAVRVEGRGDLAVYDAVFAQRRAFGPRLVGGDDAPRDTDLRLPALEAAAIAHIADELQLRGRTPQAALAAVKDYFERNFSYSTYQSARRSGATPLADFLLRTRAGHCEYFATATTLLLRAAGIPARYATGFAVQEWSPLEGAYVARVRHAHAWVRAWVDGRWIDFDTTPPAWFAVEAGEASVLQPIADLWAWVAYRYSRWQDEDPAARAITAAVLIVPLALILIWRLLLRQPIAAARARREAAAVAHDRPGADSEFYRVEAVLARAGCARARDEALSAWLTRVARERGDIALEPLARMLRLHYRYRFDPRGLSATERAALSAQAREWLAAHARIGR